MTLSTDSPATASKNLRAVLLPNFRNRNIAIDEGVFMRLLDMEESRKMVTNEEMNEVGQWKSLSPHCVTEGGEQGQCKEKPFQKVNGSLASDSFKKIGVPGEDMQHDSNHNNRNIVSVNELKKVIPLESSNESLGDRHSMVQLTVDACRQSLNPALPTGGNLIVTQEEIAENVSRPISQCKTPQGKYLVEDTLKGTAFSEKETEAELPKSCKIYDSIAASQKEKEQESEHEEGRENVTKVVNKVDEISTPSQNVNESFPEEKDSQNMQIGKENMSGFVGSMSNTNAISTENDTDIGNTESDQRAKDCKAAFDNNKNTCDPIPKLPVNPTELPSSIENEEPALSKCNEVLSAIANQSNIMVKPYHRIRIKEEPIDETEFNEENNCKESRLEQNDVEMESTTDGLFVEIKKENPACSSGNIFDKIRSQTEIVREQEAMEIASSLFLQTADSDTDKEEIDVVNVRVKEEDAGSRNELGEIETYDERGKKLSGFGEEFGESDQMEFDDRLFNAQSKSLETSYNRTIEDSEIPDISHGHSAQNDAEMDKRVENEQEHFEKDNPESSQMTAKLTAAQRLIEKFRLQMENNKGGDRKSSIQTRRKKLPAERIREKPDNNESPEAKRKAKDEVESLLTKKRAKLFVGGNESVDDRVEIVKYVAGQSTNKKSPRHPKIVARKSIQKPPSFEPKATALKAHLVEQTVVAKRSKRMASVLNHQRLAKTKNGLKRPSVKDSKQLPPSCSQGTKGVGTVEQMTTESPTRNRTYGSKNAQKQTVTVKVSVKIMCQEGPSYVKSTPRGPVNVVEKGVQITTVKKKADANTERAITEQHSSQKTTPRDTVPQKSSRLTNAVAEPKKVDSPGDANDLLKIREKNIQRLKELIKRQEQEIEKIKHEKEKKEHSSKSTKEDVTKVLVENTSSTNEEDNVYARRNLDAKKSAEKQTIPPSQQHQQLLNNTQNLSSAQVKIQAGKVTLLNPSNVVTSVASQSNAAQTSLPSPSIKPPSSAPPISGPPSVIAHANAYQSKPALTSAQPTMRPSTAPLSVSQPLPASISKTISKNKHHSATAMIASQPVIRTVALSFASSAIRMPSASTFAMQPTVVDTSVVVPSTKAPTSMPFPSTRQILQGVRNEASLATSNVSEHAFRQPYANDTDGLPKITSIHSLAGYKTTKQNQPAQYHAEKAHSINRVRNEPTTNIVDLSSDQRIGILKTLQKAKSMITDNVKQQADPVSLISTTIAPSLLNAGQTRLLATNSQPSVSNNPPRSATVILTENERSIVNAPLPTTATIPARNVPNFSNIPSVDSSATFSSRDVRENATLTNSVRKNSSLGRFNVDSRTSSLPQSQARIVNRSLVGSNSGQDRQLPMLNDNNIPSPAYQKVILIQDNGHFALLPIPENAVYPGAFHMQINNNTSGPYNMFNGNFQDEMATSGNKYHSTPITSTSNMTGSISYETKTGDGNPPFLQRAPCPIPRETLCHQVSRDNLAILGNSSNPTVPGGDRFQTSQSICALDNVTNRSKYVEMRANAPLDSKQSPLARTQPKNEFPAAGTTPPLLINKVVSLARDAGSAAVKSRSMATKPSMTNMKSTLSTVGQMKKQAVSVICPPPIKILPKPPENLEPKLTIPFDETTKKKPESKESSGPVSYDTSPFWLLKASKVKVSDDLRCKLTSRCDDDSKLYRNASNSQSNVVSQIMEKYPCTSSNKSFSIRFGAFENQFALINEKKKPWQMLPNPDEGSFIESIGLESVVDSMKEMKNNNANCEPISSSDRERYTDYRRFQEDRRSKLIRKGDGEIRGIRHHQIEKERLQKRRMRKVIRRRLKELKRGRKESKLVTPVKAKGIEGLRELVGKMRQGIGGRILVTSVASTMDKQQMKLEREPLQNSKDMFKRNKIVNISTDRRRDQDLLETPCSSTSMTDDIRRGIDKQVGGNKEIPNHIALKNLAVAVEDVLWKVNKPS